MGVRWGTDQSPHGMEFDVVLIGSATTGARVVMEPVQHALVARSKNCSLMCERRARQVVSDAR